MAGNGREERCWRDRRLFSALERRASVAAAIRKFDEDFPVEQKDFAVGGYFVQSIDSIGKFGELSVGAVGGYVVIISPDAKPLSIWIRVPGKCADDR